PPDGVVGPTRGGRVAVGGGSGAGLAGGPGGCGGGPAAPGGGGRRVLAAFPEGLAALEAPSPSAGPTEEERQAEEASARFLTGIERAQLEARLAAARDAALLAAEAERQAALEAAAAGGEAAGPWPTAVG